MYNVYMLVVIKQSPKFGHIIYASESKLYLFANSFITIEVCDRLKLVVGLWTKALALSQRLYP